MFDNIQYMKTFTGVLVKYNNAKISYRIQVQMSILSNTFVDWNVEAQMLQEEKYYLLELS